MASAIFDKKRGHWRIQYHDGVRWRRPVVPGSRRPGWKPGDPRPRAVPAEVHAALLRYRAEESAARSCRPRDPERTLDDFLALYKSDYAVRKKRRARSSIELDGACRHFLAYCQTRKLTRLAEVDRAACRGYLDHCAAGGAAHGTIKKRKALLSGAWTWATKREEIAANPWARLDLPTEAEERRRRSSWTPEQFARLVDAARPWLKDALILAVHTGLRASALVGVTFDHIDWQAGDFGVLNVPAKLDKVGRGYAVPLHRDAHDLLVRILRDRGDDGGEILRGHRGRKADRHYLGRAIRLAEKKAGLPPSDDPNHSIRRTFGRWAVLGQGPWRGRPVPLYVASRWLGHGSVKQSEEYLDLSDQVGSQFMNPG